MTSIFSKITHYEKMHLHKTKQIEVPANTGTPILKCRIAIVGKSSIIYVTFMISLVLWKGNRYISMHKMHSKLHAKKTPVLILPSVPQRHTLEVPFCFSNVTFQLSFRKVEPIFFVSHFWQKCHVRDFLYHIIRLFFL